MASYTVKNYSAYASSMAKPSSSSTSSRLDSKGYTPVSTTAKPTTAAAKTYQDKYAARDNYESPSSSKSKPSMGLGAPTKKPAAVAAPTVEDRFANAWTLSGGSNYDNPMSQPPSAIGVYETPKAQELVNYMTSSGIQDALYEAQGLINQNYTPQMQMSVRPMNADEIKKFVPVQNLNNSGITVEQLSSMDAPQQKATLESLGITNAQWVSSQGPSLMSLKEFDQEVMRSVHYGQPGLRDPETGQLIQSTADVVANEVAQNVAYDPRDYEPEDLPVAYDPKDYESSAGLMSRRLDEKGTGGTEYLTTAKPSADSMATSIASEIVMSSPDLASIISLEGFDKKPIELNSTRNLSPTQHKSGLTVGSGIDVGQYNKAGLKKAGFSDAVIKKFGDWVGLNPDTIIDPNTGVNPVQQIPRDRRFQTVTVNGRNKRVPTAEYTAARARGHELMAQKYRQMDEAGTLPEFTLGELESMAKSMWKSSGLDRAKGEYGEGWNDLPEDVKFVLAQNAYVQGQNRSDAMIDRARRGQSALQVLEAMTGPSYLESRKTNVRNWLRNNTFEDDPKMSKQGLQIMTNSLIDELGLDTPKLEVDAKVGPATRRTVDNVLRSQGVTVPANMTDAQRMELIQELTYETLLPPTGN